MEYKRIQKYEAVHSDKLAEKVISVYEKLHQGTVEVFSLRTMGCWDWHVTSRVINWLRNYIAGYNKELIQGGKKRESVNIQKFSSGEPDFDAVWTWDRHNNCVLQIAGCLLKSNLGSHPHHMRLMVSNDPPERARILRVTPALTQHTQTGESVKLHQTIVLEQQLPLDTAVPSKGHYSDLSL